LRAVATVNEPDTTTAPLGGDTIVRNTGFALAGQAISATLTAGLTIFLVRALTPHSYGLFALALAVGALALQPSDFGISQSAARFIAERRHDRSAIAAILADALRLKLIAGIAVSALLIVLAHPIASAYGESDLTWPLRAIAIAVFAQGLMTFWGTAFIALRRVSLNLRVVFSESAVETATSVVLVLTAGGATAAALGRTIGYAFGALVAMLLVLRLVGGGALSAFGSAKGHLRPIAGYAGALMIIDGAITAFAQIDALVIGAVLSATSVAIFQAPYRLTTALAYPGLALATAVAPRLSFAGEGPDVPALRSSLRYLIIIQTAVVVPILVWASPAANLVLGSDYAHSADVLRALTPYIFAAGFAPILTLGVNYLGEARRRVPIAIAAVLLNLGVDLVLIPKIGVVGGAIGTDVAFALYVGAHLWIADGLVGIGLSALLPTLARSAAAGAAAAGVLVLVGTSHLSAAQWIAGAVVSPAAFFAVILVAREFSPQELQAARHAAGAVRARLLGGGR
jgi:O-antigen/teichoic acid export membrane protein